ncbi:6380_t:CDS:1, partial [Acaulospora morrowiae]
SHAVGIDLWILYLRYTMNASADMISPKKKQPIATPVITPTSVLVVTWVITW